eukprot:GFUD01002182.1.p1 GENE.GFUD01002182.1~~GFUD01002182.1.p1  ORF type:complete len:175 (-),score=44.08 GFUD01002182.1:161-685(-)
MRKLVSLLTLLPLLACLLDSSAGQANPPSLADDTLVNTLLSISSKRGGFRRLDPSSELVMELPPGSGRVVTISDEESINFLQTQKQTNFFQELTRDVLPVKSERTNALPGVNKPLIIRDQSNTNLDSTEYNLVGYTPKYSTPNIRQRPILGGSLIQNTFLQQRPSYYRQKLFNY